MIAFCNAALAELEADRPVFLALVAACTKGSPGTPQARLLLRQDGSQVGTIGGGIMEKRILDNGIKALRQTDFRPRLQTLDHTAHAAKPSGLICGGAQSNVLVVLQPSRDLPTFRAVLHSLRRDLAATLEFSPSGLSHLPFPTTNNRPPSLHQDGPNWTFRLNLLNERRVAIFGAGHCGQALAAQMLTLDFHVTLCDERTDLDLPPSLQNATLHLGASFPAACQALQHWHRTAAVVMTSGMPSDIAALQALLPYQPPFVGLMGSRPKLTRIASQLRQQGFPESQLAAIKAPVGLPIGSDTPQEIAVSIAAQLLQEQTRIAQHEPDFANHLSS